MFRTAILATLLAVAIPASGATLRVARDGSGEYAVIQAAVDAAASGDTILIGPGRYNEGATVTTPGWTEYVRVLIRQPELTLIGSGPGQTIIGPTTPWDLSQGGNRGIEAGSYWHSLRVHVSGIGFENMGYGINGAEAPDVMTIQGCRFYNNARSVRFYSGGTLSISDSLFDQMPRNYQLMLAMLCDDVVVEHCQFALADSHYWIQTAVQLQSVSAATLTDCAFVGGDGGLSLIGVGAAVVDRCHFHNQTAADPNRLGRGIEIAGSPANVIGCYFDMQTNALRIASSPNVTVSQTVIEDVTDASIQFDDVNVLNVHDCVLARGAQYTIWQRSPCGAKSGTDIPHLDMTSNDWGTSSADSIAAWIRTCTYVVDYVPFVGQPVSTKSTNWGDLKAQFR